MKIIKKDCQQNLLHRILLQPATACQWAHVATSSVKSSAPIATLIGPAWQRLNVDTGKVMGAARCYCDICEKIWHIPFTILHKKRLIFSTGSSLRPQSHFNGHMCAHVCQRTLIVSKRRTGWSKKLLDIFNRVILLWVYKMIDMKYSG
jgi:hypothetical protein